MNFQEIVMQVISLRKSTRLAILKESNRQRLSDDVVDKLMAGRFTAQQIIRQYGDTMYELIELHLDLSDMLAVTVR